LGVNWYRDVKNFHEKFDLYCGKEPHIPIESEKNFRISLIKEEIQETLKALSEDNLVEIADGIADSIYVLLGCAIAYGINVHPVWKEVQKSNMSKEMGHKREDGKVIKTDKFIPPNIKRVIEKQILNGKS
jgi:predicted HAD superfamily Cof-like phosphohydrolase